MLFGEEHRCEKCDRSLVIPKGEKPKHKCSCSGEYKQEIIPRCPHCNSRNNKVREVIAIL